MSGSRGRGFRRGASFFPSLFTVGNLFLGFWAIVKTFRLHPEEAAPLIGWAIVLDILDGRVARLTGTESEFGGELDSLADVISFGVAPGLMAYAWGFDATLPRYGWLLCFFFVMCGTLRLARFNVQRHAVDGRYFVGMPIPAAAGQIASVIHFLPARLAQRGHALLALAGILFLSLCMVSTVRYTSFKGVDLRRRRSYLNLLLIVVPIVVVALHPDILVVVATLYSLSGPAAYLVGLFRRRSDPPPPAVVVGEAH